MVMKYPTLGSRLTVLPSVKTNSFFLSLMALSTQYTCWAHTLRTSRLIRLNSSKQPHRPLWARPL